MIEIVKREVPKNVRQMGEVRGTTKIYIEDYITTFVKQISTRDDNPKAFILYGDRQVDGEQTLLFVNGAILAECYEDGREHSTVFGEEVWKDVNEQANHFFKDAMVVGWIYLRYDLSDFIEAPVVNTHKQFFRAEQQIYMEYSVSERLEKLYLFEKGKMQLQSGYFIYYERNEAMQNYMITIKQDEPEETKPEVDRAAKKFRGIVQEKKEEIHRKQTMGMLYGTSVAMLLIVTIIGVTLMNNYEKIQNMEKVLYDISSQITDEDGNEQAGTDDLTAQEGNEQAETDDLTAQEILLAAGSGANEIQLEDVAQTLEEAVGQPEEDAADEAVAQNAEQEAEETMAAIDPTEITEQEAEEDPVIKAQEGIAVPGIYCIEKGDTLAKISNKFYGDESMIDQICEVNGIEDKNNIWYGVNIVLP